jgi:hypothetical protein
MSTQPEPMQVARETVLAELRKASGNPELAPDEDGDIRVRFGSALAFVRVLDDPPLVRVYSPVLASLDGDDRILERINAINSQLHLARLIFAHGTIFAVVDLPADPLVPSHVVRACSVLGQLADDLDDMLQAEFGGRTAFGGYRNKSMKN